MHRTLSILLIKSSGDVVHACSCMSLKSGPSLLLDCKKLVPGGILFASDRKRSLSTFPPILNVVKKYEDFVGITDVKIAQKNVLEAERDFLAGQTARREKQEALNSIQSRLQEIHADLDKTSRGEDNYLTLLTQEHAVIKQEKALREDLRVLERVERDNFTRMSACLRESHEKERERGERTKYWSIIGSVIGALIGILGSTISNRLRLHELRAMMLESADPERIKLVLQELSDRVQAQQSQVRAFVGDLRSIMSNDAVGGARNVTRSADIANVPTESGAVLSHWESMQAAIKEQDRRLSQDMTDLKRMIAAEHGYRTAQDGVIVYVGPEMTSLLDNTERNLEWKMKLNTLVIVVAVYGAFALALPVLYHVFGGAGA